MALWMIPSAVALLAVGWVASGLRARRLLRREGIHLVTADDLRGNQRALEALHKSVGEFRAALRRLQREVKEHRAALDEAMDHVAEAVMAQADGLLEAGRRVDALGEEIDALTATPPVKGAEPAWQVTWSDAANDTWSQWTT